MMPLEFYYLWMSEESGEYFRGDGSVCNQVINEYVVRDID